MKCKLLFEREVLEFFPDTGKPCAPKVLVDQCQRRGASLWAPVGTLIDDPECWRIVLLGQAEAADDECRDKTKQTLEARAAALQAAKRLAAGIRPEDFARFDAGEILGYEGDGRVIPGPNYKPPAADDDEDDAPIVINTLTPLKESK